MENFAKKGMAALVGLALVSAAGLAQAETRFAVQNGSAVDQMVVTDKGYVGVGVTAPTAPVQVKGINVAGTQVMSQCTSSSDATCGGGFLGLRNGLATDGTTTPPKAGDRLGYMFFGSMFSDGYAHNGAGIAGFAEGNWTSNSIPAYFSFETAAANQGSWSRTERMRITSIGNVGIGTKTPSQKLEVNGGLRLNTNNTTNPKPTECTAAQRGTLWMTQNDLGVADTLEICMKNGSDQYVWVQLN